VDTKSVERIIELENLFQLARRKTGGARQSAAHYGPRCVQVTRSRRNAHQPLRYLFGEPSVGQILSEMPPALSREGGGDSVVLGIRHAVCVCGIHGIQPTPNSCLVWV
jgi:hypothetical protein